MLNGGSTPFPILATERLILRQLFMSDEKEVFALRSDREINRYLDRQQSSTLDDARDFISRVSENINKNESLYWAITLNGRNYLVGTCCLFGFSDEEAKCEIGYELLPGFQGRGIMLEALKKVIDYAFNTLKVQVIEACMHQDNRSSIRLMEKLSFKRLNLSDQASPELIHFHLTNLTR
ncbi:MAG TPA: GNAT family N-acetyltransferase [Chitinophagaceae bacterium]|nr:GNAT family N-acetyltransferase [Chitinophagaceae bacterium]